MDRAAPSILSNETHLKRIPMHIQLDPRPVTSTAYKILMPVATFLLAMVVAAFPLLFIKVNPFAAYKSIFMGALGSTYGMSETLVIAIPLMFCGFAVAFPLTANRWNIGAEGQFAMGAFGASIVALYLHPFLPEHQVVLLPLMLFAGALCGMFWGAIPGFLNARFGTSEIIVSLMLNYIAINWISYLVYGPMKDPTGYSGFPLSPKFVEHARFPRIMPPSRLHVGIFLAIVCAMILYIVTKKTRIGYEIRVVGANPKTAQYGGINTPKVIILVMAVGGGLAALAGVGEVAALHHQLRQDLVVGYGYTAIPVALLGKRHPIGILLSATLFAALFVGGSNMQQDLGVPVALVSIIQALVVLFIVAGDTLQRYRIRFVRKEIS